MSQSFPIVPASAGGLWVLGVVTLLVVVVVLGGVGRSVLAGATATFEVTPEALVLRGDWWGRSIPRSALRVHDARVVDLDATPDLRPTMRTWGTGLPGYASGWFRLADGSRALLYVTERRRVAVIPTTLGYQVLLSPRDPEGLLVALGAPTSER